MEINNKFLEILQKIGELDIVEEARNTLLSEIKDLRDKVFNNLTDTKEEDNKEHDAVNHPSHYTTNTPIIRVKCECGKVIEVPIECIDVIRNMPSWKGNAIKYLWRAGLKKEQGLSDKEKEIEDCKKAIWYINDHIKHLQK